MKNRTILTARLRWLGQQLALLALLLSFAGGAWGASGDMIHNSANMGTKYWSPNGWGVSGGKYGQFTCTTCHNKTTTNIKRVVPSISNHVGYSSASGTAKSVTFNNVTGFGNDAGGHLSSKRICEVCHTQTTVHRYNTTGQTDLNHKNANNTDCTTCHPHDTAFAASCGQCHGYPPDSTTVGAGGLASPATGAITYSGSKGAHVVHTNTATFNMQCETCHNGYTTTPMGNSKIEMSFLVNATTYPGFAGTVPVARGTFTGNNTLQNGYKWYTTAQHGATLNTAASTTTCSIYCHGSTLTGGTASTPSWVGTNQATCTNTCHGMSAATPPTTPSHTTHASNSGSNLAMTCDKCHGAHTDNSHINGAVKWDLSLVSGQYKTPTGSYATTGSTGKLAPSASYGQCNNLYCHSNVQGPLGTGTPTAYAQPTWGNAGTVTCDSCHWGDTLSFKVMSTGSHRKHIAAYAYQCADCHNGAGHNTTKHADGTIDVSFAGGGTYNQTGAPNNGFSTCSNTVCHAGAATPPTWGGAPMPADCSGCHGNATTTLTLTALHYKHVNNATYGGNFTCSSCHAPTITNSNNVTIANKALHANGMVNYSGLMAGRNKTCANFYCHSNGKGTSVNPSAWAVATPLGCDGCHGQGNGTGMPLAGVANNSHPKHAPTSADCWKCHQRTASKTAGQLVPGTTDHLDRTLDARLSKVNNFVSYSGAYNNAARTCSATYCHGGAITTPAWGTANSTNCNSCHKSKPVIGGNLGLQGAHSFHIMSSSSNYNYSQAAANTSTTTAYNYTCSSCHGATISAHADGSLTSTSDATVYFGYSSAGRSPAYGSSVRTGTSTTDSQGFKWTAGTAATCNATYCHSNGRGGNGANATITWASSATTTCNSCHGNEANASTLSGAHNAHVASASTGGGFVCADCHATTISNTDNRTLANKSKHVNKFVDYSGLYAGKNKTCANFYCHSNGKGAFVNPPTWTSGTTLDCSGCHGSTSANLTTGNHSAHITAGAACYNCHWNTTQANGTIAAVAQHINKTVGVTQGSTFKSINVSFSGTTTCSGISCHSSGKFTAQTATWGTTLGCDGCHPLANLSAAHARHMGSLTASDVSFYSYTGNHSLNAAEGAPVKYGFGCGNCHPVGPTAEATYHINGSVEVTVDATSGGTYASALRKLNTTGTAGYVSGTGCDLVYCHSDGKNTMVANGNGHAPAWNYVFTAAERCAKCHGNSPQTAAHDAHQVGIHYNDIYTGTSGKLAAAATGASSHGAAAQSTTITCSTCHYKTVTTSANDQNTLCKTCHTTGHLQGDMKIGNLSFHVNGKKEISFKPSLQVISKAQLRDASFPNYSGVWVRNGGRSNYKTGATAFDTAKVAFTDTMWNASAGTCANIACHNLRTGQTVTWTDTTVSCQSCHSKL